MSTMRNNYFSRGNLFLRMKILHITREFIFADGRIYNITRGYIFADELTLPSIFFLFMPICTFCKHFKKFTGIYFRGSVGFWIFGGENVRTFVQNLRNLIPAIINSLKVYPSRGRGNQKCNRTKTKNYFTVCLAAEYGDEAM